MKHKGRGKDHSWKLVKYKGDTAIYALCSCGYRYNCSSVLNDDGSFRTYVDDDKMFPYCPYCGARKKWYDDEVKIINKFRFES